MKKKYCYTGLNRRILVLGVPLIFLFWEITCLVLSIFLFGCNVLVMLVLTFLCHLFVTKEYKKDINWINHLLFRLRIPERKVYRKDRAYLPENK